MNSFLTDKTGLWTTTGRYTSNFYKNICNENRVINIATLYLAKFFGLSVSSVINDFTYDASQTVYPNSSVDQTIYPPVNVPGMPKLPQAYWTIVAHYTSATEPTLRQVCKFRCQRCKEVNLS